MDEGLPIRVFARIDSNQSQHRISHNEWLNRAHTRPMAQQSLRSPRARIVELRHTLLIDINALKAIIG